MTDPRRHHKPVPREAAFFDEQAEGADPALVTEAADRAAVLLVRGAHDSTDSAVADRVVHLAEAEGIDAIAQLWSHAAADSLAGCLWRLYLLRSWVHAEPVAAAQQFDAGRGRAEFAEVVAGVAEPPSPDALRYMIDAVLRGIAEGDFVDVLFRASAFARVIAAGRAAVATVSSSEVRRMLMLAEQLESAGRIELDHGLG
ncbi:MAG: hypothetical protein L0H31_02455 [Nocardioidaceae bacterium]|nr:hypothetical protein [Nocardioidaceae bacterium]